MAELEFNLRDIASPTYEVRRDGASRLILSKMGSELAYALTKAGVEAIGPSSPGDGAASEESEGEAGGWIAGPEPAPYGFTYHLISPAGVQLRRLLYAATANDVLGAIRFPKGMFDQAALKRIEAASRPTRPFWRSLSRRQKAANAAIATCTSRCALSVRLCPPPISTRATIISN